MTLVVILISIQLFYRDITWSPDEPRSKLPRGSGQSHGTFWFLVVCRVSPMMIISLKASPTSHPVSDSILAQAATLLTNPSGFGSCIISINDFNLSTRNSACQA